MLLDHMKMSPQTPVDYRPEDEPVSRTYQYRKVMKPMLERKRRARINRCLDELKELMVGALHAEGENVSKLEKADILELTVRHLHGLKRQGRLNAEPESAYAEKFRAGFTQCATEVSQFIANATMAATAMQQQGPVDPQAGARLLQHLTTCIRRLEAPPLTPQTATVPQLAPRPQPVSLPQPIPVPSGLAQYQQPPIRRPQPMKPEALKRPLVPRPEYNIEAKRSCYAPPTPPESPARLTDTAQRAPWRPW